MAHRSDRREDTPITRLACEAVEQRLGPRARISMMARSETTLHQRGRRYVCSLTTGTGVSDVPRCSARVKALRPPSAVRDAQP
jgi:hypothetical protein